MFYIKLSWVQQRNGRLTIIISLVPWGFHILNLPPSITIINGLYSLFLEWTLWISFSLFLLRLEKDSHSSQHKWCFVSPSPISEYKRCWGLISINCAWAPGNPFVRKFFFYTQTWLTICKEIELNRTSIHLHHKGYLRSNTILCLT